MEISEKSCIHHHVNDCKVHYNSTSCSIDIEQIQAYAEYLEIVFHASRTKNSYMLQYTSGSTRYLSSARSSLTDVSFPSHRVASFSPIFTMLQEGNPNKGRRYRSRGHHYGRYPGCQKKRGLKIDWQQLAGLTCHTIPFVGVRRTSHDLILSRLLIEGQDKTLCGTGPP